MDSKTKGDSEHTALGRGESEGGGEQEGGCWVTRVVWVQGSQQAFSAELGRSSKDFLLGTLRGEGTVYCMCGTVVTEQLLKHDRKSLPLRFSRPFTCEKPHSSGFLLKATKALCNALLLKFTGMGFTDGKAPTRVLENTNVQPRLFLLFKLWPILPT